MKALFQRTSIPSAKDHPVVIFRKQHLGRYLTRLVTGAYDGEMVEYLDLVGKIHTPAAGSQTLDVPLVQMNSLLGFVSTAFLTTIVSCGLGRCGTVCRWSVWF